MKNPNAILPGVQDLNESIRQPEDIARLKPQTLMLEPKFDGSFIFITRDRITGGVVLCTKEGNELRLAPPADRFLKAVFTSLTAEHLYEAELEPLPWSETNKVKLNGNLYSGKTMPFQIRVILHDIIPATEIGSPKATARERYALLRTITGASAGRTDDFAVSIFAGNDAIVIGVTPCREVTRAEAMQTFISGQAAGAARKRVSFHGQDYEGMVLIDPDGIHRSGRSGKWKVKPFHSVDIRITNLRRQNAGAVMVHEMHGVDTKSGESAKITSGVTAGLFATLSRAVTQYREVVIEAQVSSLKSLPAANPTFQAIRYDKMSLREPAMQTSSHEL